MSFELKDKDREGGQPKRCRIVDIFLAKLALTNAAAPPLLRVRMYDKLVRPVHKTRQALIRLQDADLDARSYLHPRLRLRIDAGPTTDFHAPAPAPISWR
jgi:hypothetical protein